MKRSITGRKVENEKKSDLNASAFLILKFTLLEAKEIPFTCVKWDFNTIE